MIIAIFRHCIPKISDPFSTKSIFLQFSSKISKLYSFFVICYCELFQYYLSKDIEFMREYKFNVFRFLLTAEEKFLDNKNFQIISSLKILISFFIRSFRFQYYLIMVKGE